MFNFDQVSGLIRHALTTLGGYFAAKGFVDEGMVTEVVGAIMVLIGAAWSWGAKKPKKVTT